MLLEERLEIPEPIPLSGWKEVPIKECGEPLIRLNDLGPKVEVVAEYYRQGIPHTSSLQYLRLGATDRLIEAAKMLPTEFRIVVFDAYRPLSVQTALFSSQLQSLRKRYPILNEDQLIEETQRYVSIPSYDLTKPSPHATGGAVDLSIAGPGGILLDMGTEFDHFGIEAQTAYFKNQKNWEDVHNNRRLLYTIMTRAGFTNYPEEWWHFDFGNQFWGMISGQPAIYGLANLDTLNGMLPAGAISPQSETTLYAVKSDGPTETYSSRFGLAAVNADRLKETLNDLENIHHPNFYIKQQLADIVIRQHGVHKFAR